MNRTTVIRTALPLLLMGVLVSTGYLLSAGNRTAGVATFPVEVFQVSMPDFPLCDTHLTTGCTMSEVAWKALTVHTAPGVTRTAVGDAFMPNAKE